MDRLLSTYLTSRDGEEEPPDINPYDDLFGKKIVRRIVSKSSYIEKISFNEYKDKIDWENKFGFP
jgi:hypothetical protein